MKNVLILFTFLCLVLAYAHGKAAFQDIPSNSIRELQSTITKIMEETNTPAVGIALVNREGPVWVTGLGTANRTEGTPANENTMFRIASVSKMFVALAILKLQEEGKLQLDDKVHDWAPEVKFKNRWEATHPVRIIHLLEHTTGWDEIHLTEIAHNDPAPIPLKDALDFHPHSRISRWLPGTRRAYSNSGYVVAAYIVEKITGIPYEQHIREQFLVPLNMRNTTFFNDEVYQKLGAVPYNGHLEELPYRHHLYRPAAAMNSSAREMAYLLRFFLTRGRTDSLQLLSRESLSSMEIPQSTPGAKAGLELGYGLGSFTTIHNGFVYHGHDGMIEGGLTELAYLPDHGVGHVFFINASNGEAFHRISNALRDFETQQIDHNTDLYETVYEGEITIKSGYYVPINPRMQSGLFLDYLYGYERVNVAKDHVAKSWLFSGRSERFIPVSDSTFREEKTGKIGMVKAYDPLAGEVLYFDKLVMKRIPGVIVFGLLSLTTTWIILMVSGILTWVFVSVRSLIKGFNPTFVLASYVTLVSFFYLAVLGLTTLGYTDPDRLLAKPSFLSISLLIFSLLILLGTVWALITVYRSRNKPVSPFVFWQMTILSALHVLVALYLLWFDVIPVMTWM